MIVNCISWRKIHGAATTSTSAIASNFGTKDKVCS